MKEIKIPKIIHLCWFSGEEYPPIIKECINSWKRVLPDYTIKIWTAEMAISTQIPYVIEAIRVKKWAFAADVIRLYALYTEGGVYMDSDILIRERFDNFITNELIFFHEYHDTIFKSHNNPIDSMGHHINREKVVEGIGIQAAFIIGVKGHQLIEKILSYYKNRHFINSDGSLDMSIIAPYIYAKFAEELGYCYIDKKQEFKNLTIYPSQYVAGCFEECTTNSFALHCCTQSWRKPSIKNLIKIMIKRILGIDSTAKKINEFLKYTQ